MNTKKCPYCGEIIDSSANQCTCCGEMLDDVAGKANSTEVTSESANSAPSYAAAIEKDVETGEEEKEIVLDLGNYTNKFLGWTLTVIGIILAFGNAILYREAIDDENQIDKYILALTLVNILVPAALLIFYNTIRNTVAGPKFLKPMLVAIALHLWWIILMLADIETSTFVDWVEYIVFLGSFLGMLAAVVDYKPLSAVVGGMMIYPILDIISNILLDTDWVYDISIRFRHGKDLPLFFLIYGFGVVGVLLFFRCFGNFYRGKDDTDE